MLDLTVPLKCKPTAARRAFPCWDEPLLKATFSITLISREGTTNISNMPAISEETIEHGTNVPSELEQLVVSTKNEAWKITRFQTTPPMSTYIIAFANGEFKYIETTVVMPISGRTVPLRIYSKWRISETALSDRMLYLSFQLLPTSFIRLSLRST